MGQLLKALFWAVLVGVAVLYVLPQIAPDSHEDYLEHTTAEIAWHSPYRGGSDKVALEWGQDACEALDSGRAEKRTFAEGQEKGPLTDEELTYLLTQSTAYLCTDHRGETMNGW